MHFEPPAISNQRFHRRLAGVRGCGGAERLSLRVLLREPALPRSDRHPARDATALYDLGCARKRVCGQVRPQRRQRSPGADSGRGGRRQDADDDAVGMRAARYSLHSRAASHSHVSRP